MNQSQSNVLQFMLKAEQKVRTTPSIITENEAELRVKLIFEEAFEYARAMNVSVNVITTFAAENKIDGYIDLHYKSGNPHDQDLVEVADALADIMYVTYGAACAQGIDMAPIEAEVQASNMSKFLDGHRRSDGKWVEGPSYRPANIKDLIEKQMGVK